MNKNVANAQSAPFAKIRIRNSCGEQMNTASCSTNHVPVLHRCNSHLFVIIIEIISGASRSRNTEKEITFFVHVVRLLRDY